MPPGELTLLTEGDVIRGVAAGDAVRGDVIVAMARTSPAWLDPRDNHYDRLCIPSTVNARKGAHFAVIGGPRCAAN